MKLSVRWIFDHLREDYKKYSPEKIVALLNAKTAEVENAQKISFDCKNFSLVRVVDSDYNNVVCESQEWKRSLTLPIRNDVRAGSLYLAKREGKSYRWAETTDWFGQKEGLLPAFYCPENLLAGGWKRLLLDDVILEVDNKSITNRPDLWGHRGFARELSVLLNIPLRDQQEFLARIPTRETKLSYQASKQMPFTVAIKAKNECKRFAALTLEKVEHRPCCLQMAARLITVGGRAIDYIVDATNYTMFDIGQPIHAFDANSFAHKVIECRWAKQGESLLLLDGTEVEFTSKDLVITDGKKPVALAGIMGGLKSGVCPETTSLLVESANFDATTVRLTSARHKVRTEASARFEKTLDPNQNILGIQRFVKILQDGQALLKKPSMLVSVGVVVKPTVLKIPHEFIEKQLGVTLKKAFVKKMLTGLGCEVIEKGGQYVVTVPTFRSSKDITTVQDIVEEIARLHGYENIPAQLPTFSTFPVNNDAVFKLRKMKQQLAFGAHMREVENYALFDNDFLRRLNWQVNNGVTLTNPLTEQRTTLVTSLIPHLLHNISENMVEQESLRFFEWARVWNQSKKGPVEWQALSGVLFHKKEVDFFQAKQLLNELFELLDLPMQWKKTTNVPQWASQYQTADLYYGKNKVGVAGMVAHRIMARLGAGQAFAFELNGDQLLELVPAPKCFKPLPKFQATSLDISMMVPVMLTVAQIKRTIERADNKIFKVALIDEFRKADWEDQKSVTMRFWMRDPLKTLSKDLIDACYQEVKQAVTQEGAHVR